MASPAAPAASPDALDASLEKPNSRATLSYVASLSKKTQSQLAAQFLTAAERNQGNVVRCHLAAGVSCNAKAPELRAPVLCLAVQAGAEKSVKVLLDGGADVTAAGAWRLPGAPPFASPRLGAPLWRYLTPLLSVFRRGLSHRLALRSGEGPARVHASAA
jgi:hypothetical protein